MRECVHGHIYLNHTLTYTYIRVQYICVNSNICSKIYPKNALKLVHQRFDDTTQSSYSETYIHVHNSASNLNNSLPSHMYRHDKYNTPKEHLYYFLHTYPMDIDTEAAASKLTSNLSYFSQTYSQILKISQI